MRAAAIVGLGASSSDLQPFQNHPQVDWTIGLPISRDHADVILIFGGDGTIHRHLAQLVELNRPILVIPCGSGNDFARALGLYRVRHSLTAWQTFLKVRRAQTIDLGTITPILPNSTAGASCPAGATRYFCCAGACGLGSDAARRASQLPAWLRARGGYALSLLAALRAFEPVRVRVERCGDRSATEFRPMMLAVFANAPFYGGGMRLAPRAAIDDRRLDFCFVQRMNKLRLSYLFPSVYSGRHLKFREVEYFQAERLRLETERPVEVYADGEYACHTPIEVSVAPAALEVITEGA